MANLRCARLASKTRVLPAEAVFGVDAPTEIELAPLLLYCPGAGVGAVRGECQASGCRAIRRFLCGLAEIPFAGYQQGVSTSPCCGPDLGLGCGLGCDSIK